MSVYHQMGHDSKNLLTADHLKLFKGAILSPVNEDEEHLLKIIENYQNEKFETIFDPQLYYPNSERGNLPNWNYFPADVDTVDQSNLEWWEGISSKIIKTVEKLQPTSVCTPAIIPKIYNDDYYNLLVENSSFFHSNLKANIDILFTVVVRFDDLNESNRAAEIASIISASPISRIYLILISEKPPRRELDDVEALKGALKLIRFLRDADITTLIGFSSSDLFLWKFAGANDCATGKFFNLRRFTASRFAESADGGGQVSYWFEESLMAFVREPDLIRLNNADLLSVNSLDNPYGQIILNQIQETPEQAWLGHSWRQYIYWFAHFENWLENNKVDYNNFLSNSEDNWDNLVNQKPIILMEERQNNGNWLRSWRRAILEAF